MSQRPSQRSARFKNYLRARKLDIESLYLREPKTNLIYGVLKGLERDEDFAIYVCNSHYIRRGEFRHTSQSQVSERYAASSTTLVALTGFS
jgi:hypothetical protein